MKVPVVYVREVVHAIPLEGYTFETVIDKINKAGPEDCLEFGMGPAPVAFFKKDVILVGTGSIAAPVEGADELRKKFQH